MCIRWNETTAGCTLEDDGMTQELGQIQARISDP